MGDYIVLNSGASKPRNVFTFSDKKDAEQKFVESLIANGVVKTADDKDVGLYLSAGLAEHANGYVALLYVGGGE